jgi:hypothetical protein
MAGKKAKDGIGLGETTAVGELEPDAAGTWQGKAGVRLSPFMILMGTQVWGRPRALVVHSTL